MIKRLSIFLALILLSAQATAACFPSFPSFGRWQDGCGSTAEWWNDSSLTLWAPFDDPALPLTLTVGTGELSFTRATTGTYTPAGSTTMATAASGEGRVEDAGILIEGQRSNLVLYSEQFGLAANWTATRLTIDNNTIIAPDGTSTADKIVETVTSGAHFIKQVFSKATSAIGYTGSIYVKTAERVWIIVQMAITGESAYSYSYVSPDNGAIGNHGESGFSPMLVSVTDADNNWKRVIFSSTTDNSDNIGMYVYLVTSGTASSSYLGSSTSGLYLLGGHLEVGAFPSSYIGPTIAAAVTRNLDQLSFSTAGNLDNAAGTVSVQWTPRFANTVTASGNYYIFDAGALEAYWNSTDDKIYLTDGTNTISTAALTFSTDAAQDLAFTWGAAGLSITVDGTDTTGATYTASVPGENVFIGADTTPANFLYGNEKSFRVWNRQMSVSERALIAP